jgi:hypothetical protein
MDVVLNRIQCKQRYLAHRSDYITRAAMWARANPDKRAAICRKSVNRRNAEIREEVIAAYGGTCPHLG